MSEKTPAASSQESVTPSKSPCPNCGATDWTLRIGLGMRRADDMRPPVDVCNVCSPARPRRWKFSRVLVVRRWRVVTHFRAYHGNGSPNFEFEFRLGFPRFGRKEPLEDA